MKEIVLIQWIDARYNEGIRGYDELTLRPPIIQSIGWATRTDDGIIISMDYYPEDKERDVVESYRHNTVIPKECILSEKIVRID